MDLPNGTDTISYVMDAAGRRVKRLSTVSGDLDRGYLYSGARLVVELDDNDAVVSRFIYATRGHVPDLMIRGGKTYRLLTDHVGSVRLVIDTDATNPDPVVQRIDYDTWGKVLGDSNPGWQPGPATGSGSRAASMILTPTLSASVHGTMIRRSGDGPRRIRSGLPGGMGICMPMWGGSRSTGLIRVGLTRMERSSRRLCG